MDDSSNLKKWSGLRRKEIIGISIFYFILFIGCIFVIYKFNKIITIKNNEVIDTLVLSAGCTTIGSLVSYSRKIYKVSIEKSCDLEDEEENIKLSYKRIGMVLYFIWKPLYSITYSLIIVFSIILFISGLTENYNILSYQVYFIQVISYLVGYNNGKYLDTLSKTYDDKTKII